MNLQNFVSETITQIMNGITDAQKAGTDGVVNPEVDHWKSDDIMTTADIQVIHKVEFDVAITVSEGTGTQGGVGLVVGPVMLGSKGESSAENTSYSRIKFDVPITYPIPN